MKTSSIAGFAALRNAAVLAAALLLWPGAASWAGPQSQDRPASPPPGVEPAPPSDPGVDDSALEGGFDPTGGESLGLDEIDEILEAEEEVLGGGGFTYDPGDRRDPFKSLLTSQNRVDLRGPRPPGIPGLLIEELRLSGIFFSEGAWRAQVQQGNKAKSYLLREGDQLYDGDVVSISKNEVAFRQLNQDPTALKPFREVVKKLIP